MFFHKYLIFVVATLEYTIYIQKHRYILLILKMCRDKSKEYALKGQSTVHSSSSLLVLPIPNPGLV